MNDNSDIMKAYKQVIAESTSIDLATAKKIFNRVGSVLTTDGELIERNGTRHKLDQSVVDALQDLAFPKSDGGFQSTKNHYRDNPRKSSPQYTMGKDTIPGQFGNQF